MPRQFAKPLIPVAPPAPVHQQPNLNAAPFGAPKELGSMYGGVPWGTAPRPQIPEPRPVAAPPAPPKLGDIAAPGEGLPRAINYYADYGGCGLWRMIWPEMMLNGYQKAVVNSLTMMLPLPQFYGGVGAVRIQRQANKEQLLFAKDLAQFRDAMGFNLIYEIDDVVFYEDIPEYNRCRDAFADPQMRKDIASIIALCNKFSVVSPYMREYYIRKLNLDPNKVLVVPNYPPRFWLDNYYNLDHKMVRYEANRSRPRIGYCGSGTHFDVSMRTGYQDDFTHVARYVISTMKVYKWVFLGGVPPILKSFVDCGDIEVFPWTAIYDYPRKMASLDLQAVVAPLTDNEFNRAKSNIKILEAGALGIPGTFQDLPCYQGLGASLFKTGEEMMVELSKILRDSDTYASHVRKARQTAEQFWLEDHLDDYMKLYFDK